MKRENLTEEQRNYFMLGFQYGQRKSISTVKLAAISGMIMMFLFGMMVPVRCNSQTISKLETVQQDSAKVFYVKPSVGGIMGPITKSMVHYDGKDVAYQYKDSAWVVNDYDGLRMAIIHMKKDTSNKEYMHLKEVHELKKRQDSMIQVLEALLPNHDTIPVWLSYRLPSGQSGIVKGLEVSYRVQVGRALSGYTDKPQYVPVYDYHPVCYLRSDRRRFPKGTLIWKMQEPVKIK